MCVWMWAIRDIRRMGRRGDAMACRGGKRTRKTSKRGEGKKRYGREEREEGAAMEGITLSALCRRGNWWSLSDDLPHIFVFYVWRPCDVWHAGRRAAEWRVALWAAARHCDGCIEAQIMSLD